MSLTGIIFNIQRFSVHDGPGIRTTVFMKGCPLKCRWCHNPEGIDFKPVINYKTQIGNYYAVEELFNEILKDRIFYDESGGGVTFSGGEPLSQVDFLTEILGKCNSEGIHTAVDTSGYAGKNLFRKITGKTDLFLYDLKLMDPVQHLKYTEASNTEILDNLDYLLKIKAEVIVRIPMIPGITATSENMTAIRDFLIGYDTKPPVHLLPYHKIAEGKYDKFGLKYKMNGNRELTEEEIRENRLIFEKSGFDVKTGG